VVAVILMAEVEVVEALEEEEMEVEEDVEVEIANLRSELHRIKPCNYALIDD
jgi:hypothetical protein